MKLRRTLAAVVATVAVGAATIGLVQPTAANVPVLGVYEPPQGNVSGVGSFAQETGAPVGVSTQYLALGSWSSMMGDFSYLMGLIQGMPYRLALSVPMSPDGNFGDVSSNLGSFTQIAQGLVNDGFSNAVIRIAWEFNIGTSGTQCQSNPAAFVSDWQAIVNTMRAVSGQHFQFSWNSVPQVGFDISQCYPGDGYVDYISSDPYDQDYSYNPNNSPGQSALTWSHILGSPFDGLTAIASFAAAHGKQISFDEYGVGNKGDGHGLGDDPNYITSLANWVKSNNVGYISYFDENNGWDTVLGDFPNSLAAYKAAWDGAGSPTTTTPPPTTNPPPTTTPPPTPTKPGAPTNVKVSASGTTVTVTWTQPSGQVDGDDIYRDGTKIAWPGYPNPPVTSYTDSGVSTGSHSYTVSAYNSAGEGPQSSAVSVSVGTTTTTTAPPPPPPPTTTTTVPPPPPNPTYTCQLKIGSTGSVTGSCTSP